MERFAHTDPNFFPITYWLSERTDPTTGQCGATRNSVKRPQPSRILIYNALTHYSTGKAYQMHNLRSLSKEILIPKLPPKIPDSSVALSILKHTSYPSFQFVSIGSVAPPGTGFLRSRTSPWSTLVTKTSTKEEKSPQQQQQQQPKGLSKTHTGLLRDPDNTKLRIELPSRLSSFQPTDSKTKMSIAGGSDQYQGTAPRHLSSNFKFRRIMLVVGTCVWGVVFENGSIGL